MNFLDQQQTLNLALRTDLTTFIHRAFQTVLPG